MIKNEDRAKISKYNNEGFWLVKKNEEFFVSFSEYPKLGSLEFSQLTFFAEETDGVLYWESVDVTVTLAK